MTDRRTRRQFVGGAAAFAAATVLGGTGVAVARPPAATIAELRARLRGTLVRPADAGWGDAKALYNPRLDVAPRAIAFCETTADVAEVVRFARRRGWPVAARSGRHSFAGYSNAIGGIVADVSRMDAVTLDADRRIARVGGGANVLDVYRELALGHGVSLPVGTCPTVGVAGLTVGGGFGRRMRRDGITADSLRAATVVLADGSVANCSKATRPGLYWALRGGGAGYAIVTELRFTARAGEDPIAFTLAFDWPKAAAALDAWQRSLPFAPRTLSYGRFRALRLPTGTLTATVSGHWYGSETSLRALLAPLIAVGPARQTLTKRAFVDAALPDGTTRAADGSLSVKVEHFPNYQRSDFFSALLPPGAIAALLAQIERWPGAGGSGHEGGVQLDALGAVVNRHAADATAFVHRSERLHCAYLSFWGATDPPDVAAACAQWTRDTHAAMRPYASGAAYQNYIDAELGDWRQAYYGSNLARLRRIKRSYDPGDRFAFAQGVR
jgi:FAD/FMN-containing dehydrogenase